MSSDDIAISVRNLGKTYRLFGHPGDRVKQFLSLGMKKYHNEFTALHDVSFDIKRGETVGIIGRNGSGKSTLLQLICGILKPTTGSVKANGRISALLELGAGFNPEFTGRENVYFQGAVMGISKEEMDARFDDIATFAEIGEFIDQPVRTYSSGMFVRLAFAVAANVDPEILIVDEALGVGDAFFVQKCFRYFNEFRKKGSLVVVSHDMRAISGLCEQVLWLENGGMKDFSYTKKVCERYMSALFGGGAAGGAAAADQVEEDFEDQRSSFINDSNLRNDLQVFRFDFDAPSFGSGGAQIVDTRLSDTKGMPLKWVVGGELTTLLIRVRVIQNVSSPIVGFIVKDRLGQPLFGDNTYISYADKPVAAMSGSILVANFSFRMPRLPVGNYSVSVAIADGTQESHDFLQWMHDALIFESHRSSVSGVLVGLPMRTVSLEVSLEGEVGQKSTEGC